MAFICRIDKRNTHGWQVRGNGHRGYHSKLFSDGKHGGREKALAVARTYLAEMVAQLGPTGARNKPYPHRFHEGPPLSHNKSGVTGVCRSHTYHGQTGQLQEYWVAYVSIGPYGTPYSKRFYINDSREDEEAFRLAVEYRKMWEEAARQGPQAIRRFFADYESGYL
jgi:hypothetical protein